MKRKNRALGKLGGAQEGVGLEAYFNWTEVTPS